CFSFYGVRNDVEDLGFMRCHCRRNECARLGLFHVKWVPFARFIPFVVVNWEFKGLRSTVEGWIIRCELQSTGSTAYRPRGIQYLKCVLVRESLILPGCCSDLYLRRDKVGQGRAQILC